ncbi:Glycerol dehydrogenase [Clavibacter michiganensis]|uniref:Glycerol dehydrogenase n=1 Tax=Clavibacter michiganensis TaxID=28447 RepID=A0A251Y8W9_9MICO|nr:iron-containing alcohol dehydrogenase [Clavibacter michiganensis]OUE20717.1 Glycerol dehydrogenase [Clavibacter michiganensis]OUE31058.1 Glycerol dehydrogenase [Clavibacter michiganensis]
MTALMPEPDAQPVLGSLEQALDSLDIDSRSVEWISPGRAGVVASQLGATCNAIPSPTAVIGVGGGRAMDEARLRAHRSGIPVVLVPTSLASDAAFSPVSATRNHGRVEYVETGTATVVVLDEGILAHTPFAIHARGVADVLAILTSTIDCGATAPGSMALAGEARSLLEPLVTCAEALARTDRDALMDLARLMQRKIAIGVAAGHARFEEGTEHYLAYLAEESGASNRLHGDLLWAGIRACRVLQSWNDSERRVHDAIMDAIGQHFSPAVSDRLTSQKCMELLLDAPDLLRERELSNSVLLARDTPPQRLLHAGRAFVHGYEDRAC